MKNLIKVSMVPVAAAIVLNMSGAFLSVANASTGTQAPVCTNPASGVLQDFYGTTDTMLVTEGMNTVQIKNTSTDCAYKVGIASYSAYENYQVSVTSQTLYDSMTTTLQPGTTWTYTVKVPNCAYQVDVFVGDVLSNFKTATYTSQNRFLDGYFYPGSPSNTQLPMCVKPTVTPTPKPTVTPTVKPSVTPTVTPSVTPTVKPSATPTPVGQVLGATPTPTPTAPAELPSTGPGSAVVISLGGIVAALIGKKYAFVK